MGASSQITSCEFYINWCEISIMSIGHTQMSNGPLDEKKCPLDIKMSICPLDKWKWALDIQMSIRPLDEQKCPLDFQMSIRPLDEQKCPVMSSDVQWTFKCPLDILQRY